LIVKVLHDGKNGQTLAPVLLPSPRPGLTSQIVDKRLVWAVVEPLQRQYFPFPPQFRLLLKYAERTVGKNTHPSAGVTKYSSLTLLNG